MNAPTSSDADRTARLDALQTRFARRIAAALDERPLEHDIEQRLRVSRELAVSRGRAARARAASASVGATNVLVSGNGQATLGGGEGSGGAPWWVGSTTLAFVALLLLGLFAIDQMNTRAQIEAAAEIDAALLADDLPPSAYSDPGFREFVRVPLPQDAEGD